MNGNLSILTELAKAGPGLVVALILVYWFLKDRRETLRSVQQIQERSDERAKECHAIHVRTLDSLDRNTQAFGRVESAVAEMARVAAACQKH